MRIIIFLLSIALIFTPLVSAKEKGNIQIYCQPKVKVFVNGRFKSKSKEKQKGLFLKNLSYGNYEIKLTKGKIDETFFVLLNDSLFVYYSEQFTRLEDSIKTNEYLPSHDEFVPVEIQPEMIYYKAIKFPKETKGEQLPENVLIKSLINKKGNVLKSIIVKSSGFKSVDEAALKAAYQNKFKPAVQNGKPIAVWVTYEVNISYR